MPKVPRVPTMLPTAYTPTTSSFGRFSNNYSVRVSYTLAHSFGNTSGSGIAASGFQVLDDMHLELNEGPTAFDQRHNFVVSGTAVVPHTGGLNFSWVARALSGSPFSLTNANIDPDRNGTIAEPLPAGEYSGTGDDGYTVKGYEAQRNGAYGPGFFQTDLRAGYRFRFSQGKAVNAFVDFFNVTNSQTVVGEVATFGPNYKFPFNTLNPFVTRFGLRFTF